MKILICIDGGQSAEIVLNESKNFLQAFPGHELHIFNVMDISALAGGQGNDAQLLAQSMERQANDLKTATAKILGDIPFDFSTQTGYASEEIIKKVGSTHCDLVILGTHGRTGLDHLLIGSVAEKTLRMVDCNTLVIPVKRKFLRHTKA